VLSHLHEDHFDTLVAEKLNRSIPIISTLHATERLKQQGYLELYPLETWEKLEIKKNTTISITAMPGKHTLGIFDKMNELLNAIPPVMGSLITFDKFTMYISGDTLYYDELKVTPWSMLIVGNSSSVSRD
jgi:L-ascorbate metabolism protein UlaG (beta-lactamase superfamily)